MAKSKNVMTGRDDGAMIRNPDQWPSWPFLPVKRKNHSLEDKNLGVLLCTQEHDDAVKKVPGSKLIVYHVYMFDPPKSGEEWDSFPKTEYATLEALLADGWVVD